MIALLPSPMTAEKLPTGAPMLVLGFAYDEDGLVQAIVNDEDGVLTQLPLDKVRTNMRYAYDKEDWFDADVKAREEAQRAGVVEPE